MLGLYLDLDLGLYVESSVSIRLTGITQIQNQTQTPDRLLLLTSSDA